MFDDLAKTRNLAALTFFGVWEYGDLTPEQRQAIDRMLREAYEGY